jgi:DNA-binding XRE family transcriptional regulator
MGTPAKCNPVGRPSKYDPAFCEEAIAFMRKGYSQTAFAGHLGISRDTLYEWASKHPAFSYAINIAKAGRVLSLETDLLGAETGPMVTSRIFALKNAAPDDWRDKPVDEPGERTFVVRWGE